MPASMGWVGRELWPALGRVLHVRRSELGRTIRLTSIAIVLGCGLYSAFNSTQAIFLTRAGPSAYPAFFIVLALTVWPALANLSLEQLAGIDRLMVTRHYLAGEQIFKWRDHSDELYVVLEGEVRIHRDAGGNQVTLARLGPNSFMGEMAPFTDEPRSAGAEAIVPTTVRVLRKDRLGAILHEHPEVLLEVIRNLSARLVVANEQLEQAAQQLGPADPAPLPTAPAGRAREGRRRSR